MICRVCIRSSTKGDSLVPIFSKLENEFIANLIVECSGVQVVLACVLLSFNSCKFQSNKNCEVSNTK